MIGDIVHGWGFSGIAPLARSFKAMYDVGN
jgi:hypothetical protein